MHKGWIAVVALFVIIVIGLVILFIVPAPTVKAPSTEVPATSTNQVTASSLPDIINVDSPAQHAVVTSPLSISGKARGSWYFEGSAPIALLDQNGSVIAQGIISANGEWMTVDFVPFTGELTYPAQPAGSKGTLVLTNDNPSGDPAKQKTLNIPVQF